MKKLQKRFTLRNSKGFTLIELLAVIAIIGILAALILVNLNNARKQARDVQRKSIVRALAQAEESYYNANGAQYYAPLTSLASYLSSGVIPTSPTCITATGVAASWSSCFVTKGTSPNFTGYSATVYSEANPGKSFTCGEGGTCSGTF